MASQANRVQRKDGLAVAACISFTGCKACDIVIVNLCLRTVNTGQRICYLSGMRSAQVFIFRNECLWALGLLLLTFYDFDGRSGGTNSLPYSSWRAEHGQRAEV